MDIINFYYHIKMYLDIFTRLLEYLLPAYHSIKKPS